ncbi:MAG: twitching motility protein PilJ [Cocleimonas sp.]|jgi:twitching motility protein PilJ
MLNKLSINSRMLLYIILPIIIFVVIGLISIKSYQENQQAIDISEGTLKTVNLGVKLNKIVKSDYSLLIINLEQGFFSWDTAKTRANQGIEEIKNIFALYNESLSKAILESDDGKAVLEAQEVLLKDFNGIQKHFNSNEGTKEDVSALQTYAVRESFIAAPVLERSIIKITDKEYGSFNIKNSEMISKTEKSSQLILSLLLIGSGLIMLLGYLISRSISRPTKELSNVVERLAEGEYDARVKVSGNDEFFHLGNVFNNLLDDRAVTINKIDEEHQELNQSVFGLLQAVAELSERDLTIRANVTEDATGPVADALNLLAEETSDTLKKVRNVANDVHQASNKVNSHLMSINKLAMKEQERAIETTDQMNLMMDHLNLISDSAASTNIMAGTASASTKLAHESVTDTLTGMSGIRTTVQETGKRIKLLGERSQEISHVIEIIETIAERTTLLALNASMQAVAAGDEGKGFSVIAGEIQRLAESSRESTSQISTLVRNIQQETNSTIETMDKTIEQVIDGSMKAEDAADQMQKVLNTTSELVSAVDQIATASKDQVAISKGLKHKAESILKSTQVTGQELLSLTGLSRNMSDYAQQLVTSVDVFTLGDEKEKNN